MKPDNLQNRIITILLFLALGGCAATTTNINPNDEVHYDASYDFSDKKQIVDKLVSPLTTQNIIIPPGSKKPILIVYPVVNETSEHISTGGITDDIRRKLLNSGKYRFINERQRKNILKETQYQHGRVSPAMQIKLGQQLGADYIISGTLRSIKKKEAKQWRLSKSERIYYSLDLTVTDLTTGELIYADQAELAREASQPILGW